MAAARSRGRIVLSNAVVIDGTGRTPIIDAEVVIENGRIMTVGAAEITPVEVRAQRISLGGLWLVPGLVDCHVHLVGSNVGREPFGRYLERNQDVRILRIAAHSAQFLLAGVTTIRHLGHGDPRHVQELQTGIANGRISAPHVLSCGWAVSQSGGHGDLPAWPFPLVERERPSAAFRDGASALRVFVREQEAIGATWIKVFATQGTISTEERFSNLPNFSSDELKALVDEAHGIGLRVAAHATGREGTLRALLAGVDTLEHGPAMADSEVVTAAASSGATVVPTLSVVAWAAEHGNRHGLEPWAVTRARRRLGHLIETVHRFHDAGVPLAVGSDSGTPPRVMGTGEEIALLARAGFTPAEVLQMATRNAARSLGLEGRMGTIEPGKRADLVAVRADPLHDPSVLADPTRVALVIRGGEVVYPEGAAV